ncbi:MAG: hypothetical protein COC06_08080 [Bacteroidales bacterium]|nr:MAG: hypothetical protein COC06_08080 [Bacteroidales bacterium]
MMTYMLITFGILIIIVQLWAIIDVFYRVFKFGRRFKTYWIWLVILLPLIGPLIYFQRKKSELEV